MNSIQNEKYNKLGFWISKKSLAILGLFWKKFCSNHHRKNSKNSIFITLSFKNIDFTHKCMLVLISTNIFKVISKIALERTRSMSWWENEWNGRYHEFITLERSRSRSQFRPMSWSQKKSADMSTFTIAREWTVAFKRTMHNHIFLEADHVPVISRH